MTPHVKESRGIDVVQKYESDATSFLYGVGNEPFDQEPASDFEREEPMQCTCLSNATIRLLAIASVLLMIPMVAAEDEIVPPPAEETHTVKMGVLEITWDGDLRLETNRSRPLKVGTDQFGRSAEIAEVLVRSGMVRKGDVILRLDTTDIDEAIEDAEIAVKENDVRLDIAARNRRIDDESMEISMERTRLTDEQAQRDLKLFEQFRSEMMKTRRKMSLEYSQYRVEDADEELKQLQDMYGDTTLADQTKDIVLNRAKRSLDQTQRSFAMEKTDYKLFQDYDFPEQERKIRDSARWKKTDLEHAEVRHQLKMMRRELDMAKEHRTKKELQDRLDELKGDREHFVVKAPIDGIMTRIDLEPGDDVGMQQNLAQVHDPTRMALKGSIDAGDLNIVTEGMQVSVDVDAFPGLELDGSIRSIGLIGAPSGSSTSFPIEVDLQKLDPRLRLGLSCRASAGKTFRNVLAIPLDAVRRDGDRTFVGIRRGENMVEQDVVLGIDNGTSVIVIKGVEAGDDIVIPSKDGE